jgi:hypothetical protein
VIEHKATFCRICEPLCGMIATVEDGRLVALRPDKDHYSNFLCWNTVSAISGDGAFAFELLNAVPLHPEFHQHDLRVL